MVPDALDPRAWNRLGYVYGNPVNYTDPSGHCIFGLDTAVCVAAAIGALTGALIGGGAEYGVQAIETYAETGNLSDALSLQNKNLTRILIGATIGGVAGGLTGGVGTIANTGVRGFLIRTGTSAIVNVGANTSYVGTQAYFSDGATLGEASILSTQYLIKNWKRDLVIGGAASIVADVLSVGMDTFLES